MKTRFSISVYLLCIVCSLSSQSSGRIYKNIQHINFNSKSQKIELLSKIDVPPKFKTEEYRNFTDFYVLKNDLLTNVIEQAPKVLELQFELASAKEILQLSKYDLLATGFNLETSMGDQLMTDTKSLFYHGVLKSDPKSLVALSIIDGKLKILIAGQSGNIEISKSDAVYAAFYPNIQKSSGEFKCEYKSLPGSVQNRMDLSQNRVIQSACVEVYVEADYRTFLDHGQSATAVMSWISGLYNEVALLYANEGINIKLMETKIWTEEDPYSKFGNLNNLLQEFAKVVKDDYQGRLAQLVSTRNLGGGIAWVDVLCSTYSPFYHSGPYSVCTSLNGALVSFPSYSWNVNEIAHELGHNFGSKHTHDCVWGPNQNIQLDDCASHYTGLFPKPFCYNPVNPVLPQAGGTIMSYCNLGPLGINFSNGFGMEPGNLIRSNFNNAACLLNSDCGIEVSTLELICPPNFSGINVCNGSLQTATSLTGTANYEGGSGDVEVNYTDDVIQNSSCDYTIEREWTAIDELGNSVQCIQILSFKDTEAPVFQNCPPDQVIELYDDCSIPLSLPTINAIDNCDGNVDINFSMDPGSLIYVGETVVYTIATDNCGNSSQCSFKITVVDKGAPEFISCPEDMTVNSDNNCIAIVNWTLPEVNDNCAVLSLTSNHYPGDQFELGSTIVDYIALDQNGNENSCSFSIRVVDDCTQELNLICPSNFLDNRNCPIGYNISPLALGQGMATGGLQPYNIYHEDVIIQENNCVLEFERKWYVTDNKGNSNSCSQYIKIADEKAPIITGVNSESDYSCGETILYSNPESHDDCSTSELTYTDSTEPHPYGITHKRRWKATDECSNYAFQIERHFPLQNEAPVFLEQVQDVDFACDQFPQVTTPASSDDCGTINTNYDDRIVGENCAGSIVERTWVISDDSGNSASMKQVFTPIDTIAPIFAQCPRNIVLEASENCATEFHWSITVNDDNCKSNVTLESNYSPGDVFSFGQTEIIVSATDGCGNVSLCSFLVQVEDNEAPIVANCPLDISISSNQNCQAFPFWEIPIFEDACNFTVVASHEPNDAFDLGMTIVSYTVVDDYGNSNTCSFTIEVVDDCKVSYSLVTPRDTVIGANCLTTDIHPDNIGIASALGGVGQITISYFDKLVFQDECSMVISREWKAIDETDVSFSSIQTIEVIDDVPPEIISFPENIVVQAKANCRAIVEWDPVVAMDNCGAEYNSITYSHTSGTEFNVGYTSVIVAVTDQCGNSRQEFFMIEVEELSEAIDFQCPENQTIFVPDMSAVQVFWEEPILPGCGSGNDMSVSHSNGSYFGMGITTVIYTLTDNLGNQDYCYFMIELVAEDTSLCQQELMLSMDTLESGQYSASNILISNAKIHADEVVLFTAGDSIYLEPNFEVELGAELEIRIEDCEQN